MVHAGPDMASAGLLPAEAAAGATAGAGDHALLGVQAVDGGAAELSTASGFASGTGARLGDVASTVRAHPRLGAAPDT